MDAVAWRRREVKEQGVQIWPFLSIFLLILVLHCVAILLFAGGFLLTRTELPNYSNCSDVSQSPSVQPPPSLPLFDRENASRHPNFNNQRCWTKPAIDRLVVIVLDALRFDFVAPSSFFEDKKPWMDKLHVLQKLASREGSSSRIFKAIADPPTTSLQRLKGLTTGGFPTFIDVGNSFGAPAIVEDNLISQLVHNGKRVMMMGDDTWLQLFPHHFIESYPFPPFNVKDLHTVDNGCTKHLFPSSYEEDWDVLIAHFLGVDHAGHIFGVNSIPMVEKLEQYNVILEKVVEVLESQSGPGGLHENTLLLVMGDHGQTINGDHGGGNAEEVETAIFAMGLKKPPSPLLLEHDTTCQLDVDGKKVCISSIHQLDFAVTVSALLGVPFPFGSIGCVNPELYALAAGTWTLEGSVRVICQNHSNKEEWMQNYVNVLCINSWQVKRYIDVYSASSVMGFSNEDLLHLSAMYAQAVENWSHSMMKALNKNESCQASLPDLRKQIDAYVRFLASVAELARSKWTQFNLKMMSIGFCVMLISLLVHFLAIRRLNKLCGDYVLSHARPEISFGLTFSCLIVAIRACSFLSNSYICWCIMQLECLEQDSKSGTLQTLSLYCSPVTQWSLLALCLFFCTGHWCAFDGLRYAAAFIGFDEFILIPQAILLTIDTFGFSHILPIFGLPLLVARRLPFGQGEQRKRLFSVQLSQVYLMYGLITATTVTFTILCVTIQRRHLMVWGLFAPKFVFDVVSLILTDALIFLALLYYFGQVEDDAQHDQIIKK